MATVRDTDTTTRARITDAVLVGFVTVAGLLGIVIGVNVIVVTATTTANTIVEAPVRMAIGALGPTATEIPPGVDLQLSRNTLSVIGADSVSAVLARADVWGLLLAGGVIALLLVPVLRSVTAGHPFAPGTAGRLTIASVTAALGWVVAAVLPVVAAHRLIDSGMAGAHSQWFSPAFLPNYWPLGLVALLVVLAAAVRHGGRLADDADGLV